MPNESDRSRFGILEQRRLLEPALGSFQFWASWPSPMKVVGGDPDGLPEFRAEVGTARPENYRWVDAALEDAVRGYGSLARQQGTVRVRTAAAEEFKTGFKRDYRRALDRLLFKVSIRELGKREAVKLLLPVLVDASSRHLDAVFDALVALNDPHSILEAALLEYDRTGRQRFLSFAVSLLEQFGTEAWPVLRQLGLSTRPECELFVDAIANCEAVAFEHRLKTLQDLLRHPDPDVRARVVDALSELTSSAHPHFLQDTSKA